MMSRRTALYLLASFIALAKLETIFGSQRKTKMSLISHADNDVLLDESGSFFMTDKPFVTGTLRGKGLRAAAAKLQNLRKENRFRWNVGYTHGTKLKVSYAKKALDYVLGNPGLKLQVRVFQVGTPLRQGNPKLKFREYIEQVARLIDSAAGANNSPLRLITQRHFRKATQAYTEAQMRTRSKRIQKITLVQESQSDLLQVLDLIVGTVYGAHARHTSNRRMKTKADLEEYFTSKLRVSSLRASKIATGNIEISVIS